MTEKQLTIWEEQGMAAAKAPKKKRKPAEPKTPGFMEFIDWFTETYEKQFGLKYDFKNSKDASIVKRMIKNFGLETLKNMAQKLFDDDDAWVCNTDKGIGILSTKSNFYAQKVTEENHGDGSKKFNGKPRKAGF